MAIDEFQVRFSMAWLLRNEFAMGGTTDVGFSPDSDHFIVVTFSGRGLYDSKTGDRVARDHDIPDSWHRDNEVNGIGPCEGVVFPVNGIHSEIPANVQQELVDFDLDSHITEFKAAAISPNGKYLIVGYSSDIQIYDRN